MKKNKNGEGQPDSNFEIVVSVEFNRADQVSRITITSAGNDVLLRSIKDKEPGNHPWENLPGYDN